MNDDKFIEQFMYWEFVCYPSYQDTELIKVWDIKYDDTVNGD